jgi:hypothetical protein
MNDPTILSLFRAEDAERYDHLERLRDLAALSKPWLLPPFGHNSKQEALPSSFQSIIARGLQALEGQAIQTLYPSSDPWFIQTQSEAIKQAPDTDPEVYEENERMLLARSVVAASKLESHSEDDDAPRNQIGFRTAKRMSMACVFALGDSLERMNDDYSIQVFNLANYVTRRDAAGNVVYHIVREKEYIRNLSDEIISKAKIQKGNKDEYLSPSSQVEVYTMVQWQPQTRKWLERTEINNVVIREQEEPVTRYISTPLELAPEESYGHGLVELYYGDAHSLDALSERILDFATMASKLYPVIDTGSEMEESDLSRPTGTILRGRVQGGLVQDIGFVQTGKLSDFSIVQNVRDSLRQDLGAAMLVGSSSVRDSERTTATEVMAINVRELDTAVGGFFTSLQDRNQRPSVQRLFYQCERDAVFAPIRAKGAVSTKILTGVQAMAYMEKTQRVLQFTQILGQLGPEAVARLNMDKLVDVLARYTRIAEPGLVKTTKQMQAEREAAMAQATQAAAAQQAIESAGAIAEQQATQGNQ